jgi:protein gp37
MSKTSIEWTDWSVNPIRALNKRTGKVGHFCQMVSPGCAHCYASRWQPRFGMPEYAGEGKLRVLPVVDQDGDVQINEDLELFLDAEVLLKVFRRRKPTRIFWCDMTDLFGSWVPDEWLDVCFCAMALTPQHPHQVLTKRADRLGLYMLQPDRKRLIAEKAMALSNLLASVSGNHQDRIKLDDFSAAFKGPGPIRNVWLGVSVEDQQRADERIPLLLKTPAAIRFLSCEPLLGPVDLTRIRIPLGAESFMTRSALHAIDGLNKGKETPGRDKRIDWVIAGSESGHGRRAMLQGWPEALAEQCATAGVAFFMKQMAIEGKVTGDVECFPKKLQVRQYPNG